MLRLSTTCLPQSPGSPIWPLIHPPDGRQLSQLEAKRAGSRRQIRGLSLCSATDELCGFRASALSSVKWECKGDAPGCGRVPSEDSEKCPLAAGAASIVPMPTACPWLPLPGSCSKTGLDRLAGAHAFAHAIPSAWVRFLPFFVSSNLKYPQPCPPPQPGLRCL